MHKKTVYHANRPQRCERLNQFYISKQGLINDTIHYIFSVLFWDRTFDQYTRSYHTSLPAQMSRSNKASVDARPLLVG